MAKKLPSYQKWDNANYGTWNDVVNAVKAGLPDEKNYDGAGDYYLALANAQLDPNKQVLKGVKGQINPYTYKDDDRYGQLSTVYTKHPTEDGWWRILVPNPDGSVGYVDKPKQKNYDMAFGSDMAKFVAAAATMGAGISAMGAAGAGGAGGAGAGAAGAGEAGAGAAGAGGAGGAGSAGFGTGAMDMGGVLGGVEGAGGATGLGSTFGLGNPALGGTLAAGAGGAAGGAGAGAGGAAGAGGGGVMSGIQSMLPDSASSWLSAASTLGGMYSSNKASGALQDSANAASAEQRRQYDQTRADQMRLYEQQRADLQPYRTAGAESVNALAAGMRNGGEFSRPIQVGDVTAEPGYQFGLQQGEQGIDRAAAARGGRVSGATLKALARFSNDYGTTKYDNAWNRLKSESDTKYNRHAGLAGTGQTATNAINNAGSSAYGTIASAGANATNNIGQNMMGAGNARASGYMGMANALADGVGQYQNQKFQNALAAKMGLI